MSDQFHLSVVATARNDNHGGRFLYRMQHFIDGFIEQCKKHQLKAELIIVEWNPPEETELLSQALKFPSDIGPCAIRFIRVPKEVHMKLSHSDKLPLFQMIGKNVGIRRATGKYVLATNIDILFSDKLMRYLRDKLKSNTLLGVDRLDVPSELPEAVSFEEILNFCDKNYFRINGKYGTKVKIDGKWKQNRFKKIHKALHAKLLKLLFWIPRASILSVYNDIQTFLRKIKIRFLFKAHANACGDFTLMSFEDWSKVRGYPEWEIHSWHLDSILLFQARQWAIKEIDLPRTMPIYHIEHGPGSGYTPEACHTLFQRLRDNGIPYIKDADLQSIILQTGKNKPLAIYNSEKWGMSDLPLEEIRI
ncbi:MAG TPA: hypothetical protein VFU89_02440 [Rhabdochlamydiaceae bacterium]|nr:hypothetical protein [Rhabdochlamydiaceae bacterium]